MKARCRFCIKTPNLNIVLWSNLKLQTRPQLISASSPNKALEYVHDFETRFAFDIENNVDGIARLIFELSTT